VVVEPGIGRDELQAQLPAALAANQPGSGVDHVLVALASYSVGESLLAHYEDRLPALEHRYLNSLLLMNRVADCELLFLCSEAPAPEVMEYYRSIVPAASAERMARQARCVTLADGSARSLASKLLDRPDVVEAIRRTIGDRLALIEPWNVTEDEVAVARAIGAPINGSMPELWPLGFKSAGRKLFTAAGVSVPIGREDVRGVDDVLAAIEAIRAARPAVRGVVVKLDDSGAGDGNMVVSLRDDAGDPRPDDDLRATVAGLPGWYLEELAGGGVVEELVEGDGFCTPSAQVDLSPGGEATILATHDQICGGDNGQVYLGCVFPADPDYAVELARHGLAVGVELGRAGAVGRASVDFVAARDDRGSWDLRALEINLRKGGTTHPYAALRNLVPGSYDCDLGRWVVDADGTERAYRATDNVVDPAWEGRSPQSVIDAVRAAGLQFDPDRGTGVVLHMLACLAVDGRFGATAIGTSRAHAGDLFEAMVVAVQDG
jgi:hypothetical protein